MQPGGARPAGEGAGPAVGPTGGAHVAEAAYARERRSGQRGGAAESADGDERLPSVPWHFKALVGALAVYLGYRFYEMGEWLLRRL